MAEDTRIQELFASHRELRGALIFAGRYIRKLNHRSRDAKTLALLRQALKGARAVARKCAAQ
jgi:hypothetical protein